MKTQANLADPDGFYEQLLDAHQGLTPADSELLNARLILLLANQIGDARVLADCIVAARQWPGAPPPVPAPDPTRGDR